MSEFPDPDPKHTDRKVHFRLSIVAEMKDIKQFNFQNLAMDALKEFQDTFVLWEEASIATTAPGKEEREKLRELGLGRADGTFAASNGVKIGWSAQSYTY